MKVKLKRINILETTLVVIVLMVVFIILTPYVMSITKNAQIEGALSSSEGLVRAVKTTYTRENLLGILGLPFEVQYNKDGYETYSSGVKVNIKVNKTEGKLPKSGSIILNKDGETVITDLKFGPVICNKDAKSSEITCE